MSVRELNTVDVPDSVGPAETIEIFDDVYRRADDEAARVPWHVDGATPAMVAWLNTEATGLVRPGATAAVIGCGLGDDVAELCSRGYDAIGFDLCQSAVDWAKRRHPGLADRFVTADLLDLPLRMLRRHDLVVEAFTLEWLSPPARQRAAVAIASLARPHGTVLAISHGRDDDEPEERGLTPLELTTLFAAADMHASRAIDDFTDDAEPPTRFIRGAFHH